MTRALTALLLVALAGCVPAVADEVAPIDATATNLYIVSNAEIRRGWRRDQVMEDGTNLVDRSGTVADKADGAAVETVSNGAAEIADAAKAAMEALGIVPEIVPIRGGTDGARLSYMGLPCPNLCTGGYNFHGNKEFISIQSLEKMCELLLEIVKKTYKE